MSTDEIIRDREELSRADPRAQGTAADGGELRVRHLRSGAAPRREAVQWLYFGYLAAVKEQNGAAMSLGRTSTFLDIYFERDLAGGRDHRRAGPGDHRRLRHQAPHRPVPAHARVRRAVRRRSDVGDRIDRRHGRRRPIAGDQVELPYPADALQPRPRARTQPDDLVFAAAAGWVPPFRRQGRDRYQLDAVRERRDHAQRLGRRRCDRLLRVADAGRQADAVLRRQGQPGQVPALRHQRRPRRDQRRADWPGVGAGAGRVPRVRRRARQVRADDGLARRRLRQRHEHHPLHARQVRLRADRDGAARLRPAAHDGVRHGRHVGRRRQPLGDQVRQGAGRPRRDRTHHRLPDRGNVPDVRQQRQPGRSARRLAGQHLHGQAADNIRPTGTRCTPSRS